jgi:hypothetical protein
MAQAAAPTEVENFFDKLHQLIGQGSHGKIVKVADQSKDTVLLGTEPLKSSSTP